MKTSLFRSSCFLAAAIAALCAPVAAEDIDLFTTPSGNTAQIPTVVVFIDNSANWDAANQHWVSSGNGPYKQGQSELRALYNVTNEIPTGALNMGLMFFTPGPGSTPNGGYVRFAVRPMDATNKAALRELIGTPACVNGPNSLNTTPNCIFNNFATPNEKQGTAKSDYSGAMFDIFKYLGGFTDPADAFTDTPGTPVDAMHFGTARYARNGGAPEPLSDPGAYSADANKTNYNPPSSTANSCAKNFLIFVGNGYPVQDTPCTILQNVNGTTASCPQLAVPQFSVVPGSATVTLGTDALCHTPAQCATAAATTFPGYASYACTGGLATPNTPLGTDAACESVTQCQSVTAPAAGPGHSAYSCTGGTPTAAQSATDFACETPAACSARAAAQFPGHPNAYTCTGGTTAAGTVGLGTDSTRESATACMTRATSQFPGWTSYSCVSGTSPISTPSSGTSGAVCETAAACGTRMLGSHSTATCSGGTASGTISDPNCETASQCASGMSSLAGFPTGATAGACTLGSSCGGSKKTGQSAAWTCPAGKFANQTVAFTDVTYATQIMQGTGCTGAGLLQGQTMNAGACFTGMTMTGSDTCLQNQTVTGTFTVNTVTPTNTYAPPASARGADEWARYLYQTDVSAAAGQQNVRTYTIDVFKDAQDLNETALLMSMAKYGGGRYFQATSEDAILNAFREILIEIQSVNSVFAAASLPIAANNRTQNENQVFIGMFRPDGGGYPRWYGNLKEYQVALFGSDAKLADADGKEAIAATTGFIQACARSFYTTDSTQTVAGSPSYYWQFSPSSAGTCTSVANSTFNDQPDGPVVEKGATAEVLRRGNSTTALPPFTVSRTMQTCTAAPCTALVDFNSTNVPMTRTGASSAANNQSIIDYTRGLDVNDENGNANLTEPRPSIHGDVTHSRALPVNFGGTRGVELYYGSNDGALHGIHAGNGTEKWAFIGPEHHAKLKRLYDNQPFINYPNVDPSISPTPIPKDYFFDGSLGLYQDSTNSHVYIFPSQRRGGRMVYGFDVTGSGTPALLWAKGCPDLLDDLNCTSGMDGIGQTWSVPSAAFVKGYGGGAVAATSPVVIFGGGYDNCEDQITITTTCAATNKGNHVYVLDATTGALLKKFDTDRSVSSDVTLIDRDFDGNVDHVYVGDNGGGLYRIDFINPTTFAALSSASWTITKIAATTGSGRKMMFAPAALATSTAVYIALGTGDRERPLIGNYPYTTPVVNRFYMFIDKFPGSGTVNLDGSTMENFTSATTCASAIGTGKDGWFMDLPATGEQTVTSAVIFGGTVFFSTNHAVSTATNSCATNLGEAKGYAVNLLNASGVIGSGGLCGGTRAGVFTGGGLPPSPVTGTVPVRQPDGSMKPTSVLIGGIDLKTGTGSPIGAQQPPVPIKQIRSRIYWYNHQGN